MKQPPATAGKNADPPATPARPRQRLAGLWWKLPLAMAAAAMVLAILAHAVWSRVERNRVEQRLVALRAGGAPTVAKDLDRPAVRQPRPATQPSE